MASTGRHGIYGETWHLRGDMASTGRHGIYGETWHLRGDMASTAPDGIYEGDGIYDVAPTTQMASMGIGGI
jgi:hypothetical protein